MSEKKYYIHNEPFRLELGGELPELKIAYHTYGEMNAARDNVVWVCHALTASSDVEDWWPHTVEKGAFLDPERYFVVCANILGSPYGSTAPMSINPKTGEPWYGDFPKLTINDMVRAHAILADKLGIGKIHRLVGCSVGGFQAMEWAVMDPGRFEELILLATAAKASPWLIAADETQRMAIMSDETYGERRPDAAFNGLATARAIAMMTYRGPHGYNASQQDHGEVEAGGEHRACTYQQYQGLKLCRRYNVYSYVTILDAFDTHDVGRGRGGLREALKTLTMPAIVVGLTTDICFMPSEMRELAGMLPNASYHEIKSVFGHDGFLVEYEQLNALLVEK